MQHSLSCLCQHLLDYNEVGIKQQTQQRHAAVVKLLQGCSCDSASIKHGEMQTNSECNRTGTSRSGSVGSISYKDCQSNGCRNSTEMSLCYSGCGQRHKISRPTSYNIFISQRKTVTNITQCNKNESQQILTVGAQYSVKDAEVQPNITHWIIRMFSTQFQIGLDLQL